jgi:predicted DsbA family dithiol-disulfide isomerase
VGRSRWFSVLDLTVRIDIWSDVICPWCFLGKRRFDQAVEQLGGLPDIEVRWRAFQLDPRATTEPGDLRRSIEAKYGPGSFERMTGRLTALGVDEGIDYRFDLAKRVSTIDAHRLSAWAFDSGGAGAQAAMVERLFRAYFEEGANVADHPTLVSLACDVGLDPSATESMLASPAHGGDVASDLDGAIERGITAVPAFVLNDQFVIPGAQDTETFVNLLGRAVERLG